MKTQRKTERKRSNEEGEHKSVRKMSLFFARIASLLRIVTIHQMEAENRGESDGTSQTGEAKMKEEEERVNESERERGRQSE